MFISFFDDRPSFFFNSISDERRREREQRNLRIDHQLVQSYSFDHLFVVLLLTMRDQNTRSNECDKNLMTIHSLGSYYTSRWIFICRFLSIRTYIVELKAIEN